MNDYDQTRIIGCLTVIFLVVLSWTVVLWVAKAILRALGVP